MVEKASALTYYDVEFNDTLYNVITNEDFNTDAMTVTVLCDGDAVDTEEEEKVLSYFYKNS